MKHVRGDEGRDQREQAHLHEALQGGCQAAHLRKEAEGGHRHAGQGDGQAQRVQPQRQHGPGNGRRGGLGVEHVADGGDQHQGKAKGRQAIRGHLARQPSGQAGTGDHADRHRDEHPAERGFLEAKNPDDVGRGRTDVEGDAGEEQADAQQHQHEARRAQGQRIVAEDGAEPHRCALLGGQGLGHAPLAQRPQDGGIQGQQHEDRMPAEGGLQPATDHRGHRGGDAEHHRDQGHHPLGFRPRKAVLHHGTRQHHADAGTDTLQGTRQQQGLDAVGKDGEHRGRSIEEHRSQHHRPPPERIGQGAGKQHGDGHDTDVDAERLLHRHRRDLQIGDDGRKRGQVGVDAQGSDHCQHGQDDGDAGVLEHGPEFSRKGGTVRVSVGPMARRRHDGQAASRAGRRHGGP